MYVYLQAYEQGAATMQPLIAFVSFYRGQKKAFETQPIEVTSGAEQPAENDAARFSIALRQLPPGKYDCQVTVLNPTGQKAAFWLAYRAGSVARDADWPPSIASYYRRRWSRYWNLLRLPIPPPARRCPRPPTPAPARSPDRDLHTPAPGRRNSRWPIHYRSSLW